MTKEVNLAIFEGQQSKSKFHWEIFSETKKGVPYSMVYPAINPAIAMLAFKEDFGTDPILGVLRYDLIVRGDYVPKYQKTLPYCFIIKRKPEVKS